MADGVRFRRYEPGDAEAVVALHRWGLSDAGTDPDDVPGTDDVHTVSESYLDSGGDFVVGIGTRDDASNAERTPGDAEGAPSSESGSPERQPPQVADGPLVAIGGYLPTEDGYKDERSVAGAAELHRMRVAPTHQGQGYGRALLEELERRAIEAGFDRLLATTARRQERAVAFYPSAGYREVDRTQHGEYELVHFEKRL